MALSQCLESLQALQLQMVFCNQWHELPWRLSSNIENRAIADDIET